MSDPARFDDARAADTLAGRDRDARVEQLLLAGLDHYFAGRYEQAVHIWTRVLFLDRGHARARAYIERARSALAERQRQSEELLHRGTAAFERGQSGDARSLLTAAVEQGAAPEVALGYLERLDRLAPASPAAEPLVHEARPSIGAPSGKYRARAWAVVPWLAASALVGATLFWYADAVRDLAGWPADRERVAPVASQPQGALPMPRPSEIAITRARTLFATGHAAEAVDLLTAVPLADPNRREAERVLADIQRVLLATAGPSTAREGLPE
jgi:hypothetical protein